MRREDEKMCEDVKMMMINVDVKMRRCEEEKM